MCAINPVHKKRIIFDVYTSDSQMTREEFERILISYSLMTELLLNLKTKLRWHLKESKEEAE